MTRVRNESGKQKAKKKAKADCISDENVFQLDSYVNRVPKTNTAIYAESVHPDRSIKSSEELNVRWKWWMPGKWWARANLCYGAFTPLSANSGDCKNVVTDQMQSQKDSFVGSILVQAERLSHNAVTEVSESDSGFDNQLSDVDPPNYMSCSTKRWKSTSNGLIELGNCHFWRSEPFSLRINISDCSNARQCLL